MALTNKVWALLAAVGCAMIWLALLFHIDTGGGPQTDADDPLAGWHPARPSALAIAEGRVAAANDRLRTLEIRDSLVKLAGTHPGFFVTVDSRLPAETGDRIRSLVEQHWTALGVPANRAVIVAVVGDTVVRPHELPRQEISPLAVPIDAFLPGANTGGACVSVLRLRLIPRSNMQGLRQFRATLSSSETINALLSPCAFFAAFGDPGPAIRNWVANSQLAASKFAAWNEQSDPWRPALNETPYGMNLAEEIALNTDPAWRLRRYVAPEGIACIANEANACSDILLRTRPPRGDSAWRANVVRSSGTTLSSFYLPRHPLPLGPSDGWILSEMARTLGRERFEKFWKSPLPVAEAFNQAAGEDIQDWTRRWAVRTYGPAQVGPAMSTLGLSTGLLIVLLGLGGATFVEWRRRVA